MRPLILLILLLSGQISFGQKQVIIFQANSGLFSFGGESTSTSFMNMSDAGSISSYTNNPYGRNSGFSFGFGIQFQQLTSKNFIYGLLLSYEALSSKLTIDNAYGEITWSVKEGKTILTNNFINLFPSIGKRISLFNGIDSDILFGFDFGIGLSSKEHYSLTSNQGHHISGTNERDIPAIDFRPRIEFINYYKNFGLSIGYSYGMTNYESGYDGANQQIYARYVRFGLNYRLR